MNPARFSTGAVERVHVGVCMGLPRYPALPFPSLLQRNRMVLRDQKGEVLSVKGPHFPVL